MSPASSSAPSAPAPGQGAAEVVEHPLVVRPGCGQVGGRVEQARAPGGDAGGLGEAQQVHAHPRDEFGERADEPGVGAVDVVERDDRAETGEGAVGQGEAGEQPVDAGDPGALADPGQPVLGAVARVDAPADLRALDEAAEPFEALGVEAEGARDRFARGQRDQVGSGGARGRQGEEDEEDVDHLVRPRQRGARDAGPQVVARMVSGGVGGPEVGLEQRRVGGDVGAQHGDLSRLQGRVGGEGVAQGLAQHLHLAVGAVARVDGHRAVGRDRCVGRTALADAALEEPEHGPDADGRPVGAGPGAVRDVDRGLLPAPPALGAGRPVSLPQRAADGAGLLGRAELPDLDGEPLGQGGQQLDVGRWGRLDAGRPQRDRQCRGIGPAHPLQELLVAQPRVGPAGEGRREALPQERLPPVAVGQRGAERVDGGALGPGGEHAGAVPQVAAQDPGPALGGGDQAPRGGARGLLGGRVAVEVAPDEREPRLVGALAQEGGDAEGEGAGAPGVLVGVEAEQRVLELGSQPAHRRGPDAGEDLRPAGGGREPLRDAAPVRGAGRDEYRQDEGVGGVLGEEGAGPGADLGPGAAARHDGPARRAHGAPGRLLPDRSRVHHAPHLRQRHRQRTRTRPPPGSGPVGGARLRLPS